MSVNFHIFAQSFCISYVEIQIPIEKKNYKNMAFK